MTSILLMTAIHRSTTGGLAPGRGHLWFLLSVVGLPSDVTTEGPEPESL